ncbi:hypothetical protein AA0Y32_16955 [Georgenia phoenicis]|uniref:hypothetical protein n=1 Tax=unclassified Georgenia TaxID=2626815 RepID=UPI0039B03B95
MTNVPPAGAQPERTSNAGMPRWVKVFGSIAIVVLLLLLALALLLPGGHGPGMHALSVVDGETTTPNITQVLAPTDT